MADTLNALMGRLRIRQLNLLIALDEHRSLHRAAAAAVGEVDGSVGEVEGAEVGFLHRGGHGGSPDRDGHAAGQACLS